MPTPRALIDAALKIAKLLWERDGARYKPLFVFINGSAKERKPAWMIFESVKKLAERERNNRPVTDVNEYLRGTLRKLEIEQETRRLRAGRRDAAQIGEINFTLKSFSERHSRAGGNPGERAKPETRDLRHETAKPTRDPRL